MLEHLATLLVLTFIMAFPASSQSGAAEDAESSKAREFWNDKFRSGLPNVRREPSRLLVEAIAEYQKLGAALDVGCGEGRNLLYLAEGAGQ